MIKTFLFIYVIIGLIVYYIGYIYCCKVFLRELEKKNKKKEKLEQRFSEWLEENSYEELIMFSSIFWIISCPIIIINELTYFIAELIKKHYNLK